MTKNTFIEKYGEECRKFFNSEAGGAFFQLIASCAPQYEVHKEDHLFIENRGVVRGYGMCLKNIGNALTIVKPVEEPQANYGVPERKGENII